jgi:hypothetical protein
MLASLKAGSRQVRSDCVIAAGHWRETAIASLEAMTSNPEMTNTTEAAQHHTFPRIG